MTEAVKERAIDENEIKEIVKTFPIRDTSKFTHIELETRATYPRAYEFWSEEEEKLLIQVANDIKNPVKLSQLFQRQPSAIQNRLKDRHNIIL